jgi:2-keto-4-pentenoate hydratase/2-oxohepta-3-ene-1,7-dioic acid hydratase in catechol pathway
MKLVTFIRLDDTSGRQALGVLDESGDSVIDLQEAATIRGGPQAAFADMLAFLAGGAQARNEAARVAASAGAACRVARGAVKLLAPVPRPLTLRDTLCYEDHYVNCIKVVHAMQGKDVSKMRPEELKPPKIWYEMPLFYKGNVNSVIGTDEDVAYPEGERFRDYELELAVYIGKQGKNINARDAMAYVGGYTILNDFSARMTQVKEMDKDFHLGPAHGKDFANAMGPCMVTPDAFDSNNAVAVARVNGEERARSNVGLAYHKLADVIEYASTNTTLYPGDVIAMGTVPLGSGFEIGRPLLLGDVVELEIAGIGVLRNRVVAPGVTKIRNRRKHYKRYVCAGTSGKSDIVIDDYPDVTKSNYVDIWKVTETPAVGSATAAVDLGNSPWDHEPPPGGSTYRFVQLSPEVKSLPKLAALPAPQRKLYVDMIQGYHREIGTHHIPQEADLVKSLTMHKTDSINLFVCLAGLVTSINDEDEIELKPGDAFVQLASMHAWSYRGEPPCFLGGLLVDADRESMTQLAALPQPKLKSATKRFKRYVSGTVKSADKASGKSKVLIDDYAPNEAEIFDGTGKHIGWAGDIWRTGSPSADASGLEDTVTGPMESRPPRNGINFRMVELLPGCRLPTNQDVVNYYTIIKGELTATSQGKSVVAKAQEHLVQLRSQLTLENTGGENVLLAHYMIDAKGASPR